VTRRDFRSRAGAALSTVALAVVAALAAAPADAQDRGVHVETVATGLESPWEIAFLADGRALVTERPGRVRLLSRHGRLRHRPLARVPVSAVGEGGLLGVAVDPAFTSNRFVYLYFTTATEREPDQRVYDRRLQRTDDALLSGRPGCLQAVCRSIGPTPVMS
jgi:aldose sugar dehydrogenase